MLVTVGAVTSAMVTAVDCGDPDSPVWALPAVSDTENELALVNVDVTGDPVTAVEVAEIVQTVDEV
jgi:hypothetical protein